MVVTSNPNLMGLDELLKLKLSPGEHRIITEYGDEYVIVIADDTGKPVVVGRTASTFPERKFSAKGIE